MPFAMAGYELAHHGQGRWNGVAIASRVGIADVVTNFGDGPVAGRRAAGSPDDAEAPADDGLGPEARMISARCGGIRVVSIYAPNGRALDTPFYEGKLAWFDRLSRWLDETQDPADDLLIGGDFNVAPDDLDVYDPLAYVGATHVSPRRTRCAGPAPRMGPARPGPAVPSRGRLLHLVGLPGRQLPQEPGHADRPPVCHPVGRRAGHRRRTRSGRSQGQAAVRPCPAVCRSGGLS